jgi:hypothetical protein
MNFTNSELKLRSKQRMASVFTDCYGGSAIGKFQVWLQCYLRIFKQLGSNVRKVHEPKPN